MADVNRESDERRELADRIEDLNRTIEALDGTVSATNKLAVSSARAVRGVTNLAGTLVETGRGVRREGFGGFAMRSAMQTRMLGGSGNLLGGMAGMGGAGNLGKIMLGLRFFGAVGVAIGGAAAIRSALGGGRGRGGAAGGTALDSFQSGAERQTAILSQILAESRRANITTQQVQARRAAEMDPFGFSAATHRARMRRAGTLADPRQIEAAAGVTAAQQRRNEAIEARNRELQTITAPFREINAIRQTAMARLEARTIRGARRIGTGFLQGMGVDTDFLRRLRPIRDATESGFLGGSQQRELFEAQTRGPGNVLQAPMTVRAGTESEYAFRVAQQRRAMQQEQTVRWQDRVLNALETLVERDVLDGDVLYRTRIEFGRAGEGV